MGSKSGKRFVTPGVQIKTAMLLGLMVLILKPTSLMAHEHGGLNGPMTFPSEKGSLGQVTGFMRNLAVLYSQEVERGTRDGGMSVQPGLGGEDRFFIEQQEAQAKFAAKEAFQSIVRKSMEEIDVLHHLRTYGDRLTSVHLRIGTDTFELSGPSIRARDHEGNVGNEKDKPLLLVHSGVLPSTNAHFAPTLRADVAGLKSKLIYDPGSGGDWSFSMGHSITSRSTVEMIYLRHSADDQNLVATFRLGF